MMKINKKAVTDGSGLGETFEGFEKVRLGDFSAASGSEPVPIKLLVFVCLSRST